MRDIWFKEVEDFFDKVGFYIIIMRDENLFILIVYKK